MVFAVMFYTMVRKKCHPFCTCCSCRNWMEQRRCSLSNCLATSWPQGEKPNFSDSSDRLLVFKLRRNLTATCDLLHLVHFGPRGFCLRVRLEWRWTSLPMGQGHGQRRIHRKHHGFTQGHCAELVFVKTIWSNAAWVLQFNMLTNEFRTLCWHVMTCWSHEWSACACRPQEVETSVLRATVCGTRSKVDAKQTSYGLLQFLLR